jgi:integrase
VFMETLRGESSIPARALEFTILGGFRLGEVQAARWSWVDWRGGILNIPAEFVKVREAQRRPLSTRMVDILRELKVEKGEVIFPRDGVRSLEHGMRRVLAACLPEEADKATVHGFRATLRTWAAEQTNFPREICELALGHIAKGQVEAAYWRGTATEKCRALLESWARFCSGPPAENVVGLHRSGAAA